MNSEVPAGMGGNILVPGGGTLHESNVAPFEDGQFFFTEYVWGDQCGRTIDKDEDRRPSKPVSK